MDINVYFRGGSNRRDYLVGFIAVIAVSFVVSVPIFFVVDINQNPILFRLVYAFPILLSLPVACRRMHDIGHSGLWLLGAIWFPLLGLLLLSSLSGQDKPNKYGDILVRVGGFFGALYKSGSIKENNKK